MFRGRPRRSVERDVRRSETAELPRRALPPRSLAPELEQAAARVRDAVRELEREGEPVRFRHSTIVASDESFLCVLEAQSEEFVRVAYARANVPFERISVALTEGQ